MSHRSDSYSSTAEDWFASWEAAGVEEIERDLIKNDGKRYCGGSGDLRRMAWRWLRNKRVASLQVAYGRGRR